MDQSNTLSLLVQRVFGDEAYQACKGRDFDLGKVSYGYGWDAAREHFEQYVSEHGIPSSGAPLTQGEEGSPGATGWVNVKDRLPEHRAFVLVCKKWSHLGEPCPFVAQFEAGGDEWAFYTVHGVAIRSTLVTELEGCAVFWLPIPKFLDAPAAGATSEGKEPPQQPKNDSAEGELGATRELWKMIGFLVSCIHSGEALTPDDEQRLDALKARYAPTSEPSNNAVGGGG